jgi:hypothetical protein
MDNFEHRDIFELLSVDMNLGRLDVKDILLTKGTSAFMEYLKKLDLFIHKTELILDSEIRDANSKILINSGISINKYLPTLLERYVRDDQFATSPFHIKSTENSLNMYRGRAYEKLDKILDHYIYGEDTFGNLINSNPQVRNDFRGIVDNVMSTPKGISAMLKFMGGFDRHKELVINSMNSSLISLGLASVSNKPTDVSKVLATKAGTVCLFQNIKEIAGNEFRESNAGDIIRSLINDETLEQAVLMFANNTHDSAPIFSDKINRTNYYLRVLVTVSLFVDLVYQNKTNAHNLEVHKSLYELAEDGYADREITVMLGKLFLPEAKYLILEHAYSIRNKCGEKPVIWSSVGDMLPVKFLCRKETCQHCGQHKTFIPKDVHIKSLNAFTTSITAGLYYTCNLLTDDLQKYYKSIIHDKD